MSQQELLRKVIRVLKRADVDYMVTGSIVSSLQGEPRATHDIDLIVDIQPADVRAIVESFQPPDYYLDEDTILEAIQRKTMFNLIDINNGDKVDFWILTEEPFDQSRFNRRYVEQTEEIEFQVSRPEDTILAKLRWAALSGGSEKQFTDALRVYEVQFSELDVPYIEHWIRQLALESFWERLVAEAEPL
jgi:hypothetical protein